MDKLSLGKLGTCLWIVATCSFLLSPAAPAEDRPIIPVIEGGWRSIANNPDLPNGYQSDRQQPVDFGVWQAADGTWQLWSCIRHTNAGGHTRLFYGWEGESLTSRDWKPQGIKMESDAQYGEPLHGLQAPHVVRLEDRFLMAYGNWDEICFAESQDGKHFKRVVQPDGRTGVFGEGPRANTRDAMLINIVDLWHCYYTAILGGNGYGFCRTSEDLKTWSDSFVVSYGGRVGSSPWFNECPHVVEVVPGEFVYFRNQYYGENQTNWVYYSQNPRYFGIDDDSGLVCSLPVAAPEIIDHDGDYYIASLKPGLDGIQLARLGFYRRGAPGRPVFDFDSIDGQAAWTVTEGQIDLVFCEEPHQDFEQPAKFLIGTSEKQDGGFDDAFTGVIESQPFTLTADHYYFYVSGGHDAERRYVAIVDDGTGEELVRWTGQNSNRFERQSYAPGDRKGATVRIRIVDQSTGGWGHINFGGIYEEGPRERIR